MKQTKLFLINILLAACILFTNSRSTAQTKNNSPSEIVLAASTPGESISFLAGDSNVIFFLDNSGQLLIGDNAFSFTLNRTKK